MKSKQFYTKRIENVFGTGWEFKEREDGVIYFFRYIYSLKEKKFVKQRIKIDFDDELAYSFTQYIEDPTLDLIYYYLVEEIKDISFKDFLQKAKKELKEEGEE